jgi:hypothetical protein
LPVYLYTCIPVYLYTCLPVYLYTNLPLNPIPYSTEISSQ